MKILGGHATTWGMGDGPLDGEADTFTCGHCQRITHIKPMCPPVDAGGLCYQCDRLICKRCVGLRVCVPFEKMIERMEARRNYDEAAR